MKSVKLSVLLAAISLSILACAGCQQAGDGRSAAGSAGRDGKARANAEASAGSDARTTAENTGTRTVGTTQDGTGEEATAEDTGGGAAPDQVTLEVGGDRGTRFIGTCAVGDGEKKFRGRVPERFVYEPGGRSLECVVRKRGTGALEVVLVAGESRYVQRAGARWAKMSFTYSERGFVSSIRSSASVDPGSRTVVSSSSSSASSSSTDSHR